MSKNKKFKEVPRYQLIEIPSMFLIMACIGFLIYGINSTVSAFQAHTTLNAVEFLIFSIVSLATAAYAVWCITSSSIPKRGVPMIVCTAILMLVYGSIFFLKPIANLTAILALVLLVLILAGAIVLKVRGTKIEQSLPAQPEKTHHKKKKKK